MDDSKASEALIPLFKVGQLLNQGMKTPLLQLTAPTDRS